MKQLTNASFHDFDKAPLFVGTYDGEKLIREEDQPAKEGNGKKGDIMAYGHMDLDGMNVWVGASSTIGATIEADEEKKKPALEKGTILSYEFQGKALTKAKKTFRKFKIIQFDSIDEAMEYHKIEA